MDTLPTDRVVEIAREGRSVVYGVGRYRGSIVPRASRWAWRAWDVLMPSLGGRGTLASGVARTKSEAMERCLAVLRREAGIEQYPTGGGGPVEGES